MAAYSRLFRTFHGYPRASMPPWHIMHIVDDSLSIYALGFY